MPKLLLKSKIRKVDNSDKKRVAILGYTGNPVSLRDMGFPEPLVYNLAGFVIPNNIPYYEEHKTLIGHTVENQDIDGELYTIAEHSVENDESERVYSSIKNGEPYEASMGVEIDLSQVQFYGPGTTVTVNNKTFNGPIFVANKGTVDEMTATKSGRDGGTSIHKLSTEYQEGKEILMKVKNAQPDLSYLTAYENDEQAKALIKNAKEEGWDEDKFKAELKKIKNKKPGPPKPDIPDFSYLFNYLEDEDARKIIKNAKDNGWTEDQFKVELQKVKNAKPPISFDWLFDYVDHPEGRTLIKNARAEGWDEDRMKREIEVVKIKNSYPGVPGVHLPQKTKEGEALFLARLANSIGVKHETIKKHVGDKIADSACDMPMMGMKEGLMLCANANGGRFNGHSDAENVAKHIKRLAVQNAFSTIDYPNAMHKVTEWRLEDTWMIDEPQSPAYCKEVSGTDLREEGYLKMRGGKMWEVINKEGKLSHGSHGQEDKYTTEITTIGQILTFKREDIINDSVGWVEETLDLMLEGALMAPDYMFTHLFYEAKNNGVTTDGESWFTLALTKENLKTVYDQVRRRQTIKSAPKGAKQVNGRVNTRWNLVIPPTLEETAWDIIKQDRIVQNDVKGAAGDVGDRNYWFNRLDISVFDNLDNTTYHAGARPDAWGVLPDREMMRPFYIRYLNRQRRPVVETVDLPSDMLGFGVRGYWDLNEGYRPLEGDKLQHCGISVPTT